jgi:hypothetical protein
VVSAPLSIKAEVRFPLTLQGMTNCCFLILWRVLSGPFLTKLLLDRSARVRVRSSIRLKGFV